MTPQSSFIFDINEEATIIENALASFITYDEGYYGRWDTKPRLIPDKKYVWYRDKQEVVVSNLNEVVGTIYDAESGEVVINIPPYSKAQDVLFRRPMIPVIGVSLVKSYIDWVIESKMKWSTKSLLSDKISEYISNVNTAPVIMYNGSRTDANQLRYMRLAQIPINVNNISVDYGEKLETQIENLLRQTTVYLRDTIVGIIGNNLWDIYSCSVIRHTSIKFEKFGDYRVYEWMRINRPGEEFEY